MIGYVAVMIVFMVFFEVDLISYIALLFSKTVVDLSGCFADVKGLTFGADDPVDYTGCRAGKLGSDQWSIS